MKRAIVMKSKDNVATVMEIVNPSEAVYFEVKGIKKTIKAKAAIPNGHKIAIKDIAVGEAVVKYGETIGAAIQCIGEGEHVHVHNVESCRGRGDK